MMSSIANVAPWRHRLSGRSLVSLSLCTLVVCATSVRSQSRLFEISGEITDQRGDVIVGARVTVEFRNRPALSRSAISDGRGRFRISDLPAGSCLLKVDAQSFGGYEKTLAFADGNDTVSLRITLYPALTEKVTVNEDAQRVALDPDRAAGARVLKEEDLKALPDDPDRFADLLQLLATSSGSAPGGASVTVDGFATDGRLPPKSAIREVRINSNIFSAEYDKPPYRGGRIDIYTKPGASAFHGSAFFNFNDSVLNARETFAPSREPSRTERYGLQFGGPLVKKRSGFLVDFEARDIEELASVNAVGLDAAFQPTSIRQSLKKPEGLILASVRADGQIGPSATLAVRYDLYRANLRNEGVGGFDLAARAYNSSVTSHGLKITQNSIFGRKILNEGRVGLTRFLDGQQAVSKTAAIQVLGAFTDGGASVQNLAQKEWRFEAGDNLSVVSGRHSLRLGMQILGKSITDTREDNFNGTFTFGGRLAPRLEQRLAEPELVSISGLEQYRRTLLGLPGGGPTRFSISRGDATVTASHWTFAAFVQNELRARDNVLLSLGLRYEGQTNPNDGASLGPRLGIAYSPDRKRNWVLRARSGLFYERINESLALESARLNGKRSQTILIDRPSFPDPFQSGAEAGPIPTIRRMDPRLRPPVSFQTQVGFERQLRRGWRLDVSHYWSRSWAGLRSRNINAPLIDGTAAPSETRRPFGINEDVLSFESTARTKGQVIFVGANQAASKRFNIFSGYLFFDFHSDADHAFMLPQSSYDVRGEWARPGWQARHRLFLVSIVNLPMSLRASSELNFASGTPFDITTGRDANGDGNFNDRPSPIFRSDPRAIPTALGSFDATVVNGTVGRNAGTNPPTATVDLNLSRTFVIGGKRGERDGGCQVAINGRASNLLNRTNVTGVQGVLTSPFFGAANDAGPARRIELGVRFSF